MKKEEGNEGIAEDSRPPLSPQNRRLFQDRLLWGEIRAGLESNLVAEAGISRKIRDI